MERYQDSNNPLNGAEHQSGKPCIKNGVTQIHNDWPTDSFEEPGTYSFLVETGSLVEYVHAHSSMSPRGVYVMAFARAQGKSNPPAKLGMVTSLCGGKLLKDNALWMLTESVLAAIQDMSVKP